MDRINKVYINPNFKKDLDKPVQNTEHFNSSNNYYLQKVQHAKSQVNVKSSRKIYLNPNFKQLAQSHYAPSTLLAADNSEYTKANPAYVCQSKYSLVYNRLTNKEHEKNCISNISHYNTDSTIHKPNPYYGNNLKVKSRYSLVTKKVSYQNLTKSNPIIQGGTINESTNVFNNVSPYSNISLPKYVEAKKPEEKVAKIKLSKYKTVPIAYLKENSSKFNKNKEYRLNKMSHIKNNKSGRYQLPSTYMRNKNRFNLTRSEPKLISEITPTKPSSQPSKKNTWQNHSKVKLEKANFKLNNIPCQLFRKYGKCLRKDNGKCEYLHDKKHVSLCRKFLKGICHDNNCLLSHESTANKMPTCYFFLQGMCTKENCPYLHIKLSDKIKICPNFAKGYCDKGDRCNFRHVKLNVSKKVKLSSLITTNKLSQGKIIKSLKKEDAKCQINRKQSLTLSKDENVEKLQNEDGNVNCRYYKDTGANEDVCENIKPSRCVLGPLPSFIQL